MGNTKLYYVEGELLKGATLDEFKERAAETFRYVYCVAEIVEPSGGYLGPRACGNSTEANERGPYLVGAIHSYSLGGDEGPLGISPLFWTLRVHRLDLENDQVKSWWISESEPGGTRKLCTAEGDLE